MPRSASRGASASVNAGSTVDESTTMPPSVNASTAPSGANSTASTCGASTTSTIAIRAPRATSAGELAATAPRATAVACTSGRMSRARTGKPARNSDVTTPIPIAPVPMTPTGSAMGLPVEQSSLSAPDRPSAGSESVDQDFGTITGSQPMRVLGEPSRISVSSMPLPRSSIRPLEYRTPESLATLIQIHAVATGEQQPRFLLGETHDQPFAVELARERIFRRLFFLLAGLAAGEKRQQDEQGGVTKHGTPGGGGGRAEDSMRTTVWPRRTCSTGG
jgi:hypothetical protein